ncbi:MAG TPA: energy transducer TonB [Flavobacteriales bacterium]|nr:energy transducer TonB [Flavobacteriales bacterium]HPH83116.1 energy transducer TonB [Flavobacteriales bacterium]
MPFSRLFLIISLIFSSPTLINAQILREPIVEPTEPPDVDTKEQVFTIVEEMPVFENGKDDINTFLAKNINYPLECKESSIQGTVFIKFVVQAAGGIRDIQVMKSPKECNMLEKEAIRVVKLSGNYWKAGKQNGKKVDVYNILPIRFKLQ